MRNILVLTALLLLSSNMVVKAEEQETITVAFCDKWEELTDAERTAYTILLQQEVAEDLNITVPTTVFYNDNDNCIGKYSFKLNTLYINNNYMDNPYKIMSAVFHEMRHAWQDKQIESGTELGQQYADNLNNYILPSAEDAQSYATDNIIEYDAFKYQFAQVGKY